MSRSTNIGVQRQEAQRTVDPFTAANTARYPQKVLCHIGLWIAHGSSSITGAAADAATVERRHQTTRILQAPDPNTSSCDHREGAYSCSRDPACAVETSGPADESATFVPVVSRSAESNVAVSNPDTSTAR